MTFKWIESCYLGIHDNLTWGRGVRRWVSRWAVWEKMRRVTVVHECPPRLYYGETVLLWWDGSMVSQFYYGEMVQLRWDDSTKVERYYMFFFWPRAYLDILVDNMSNVPHKRHPWTLKGQPPSDPKVWPCLITCSSGETMINLKDYECHILNRVYLDILVDNVSNVPHKSHPWTLTGRQLRGVTVLDCPWAGQARPCETGNIHAHVLSGKS